MKNYLFILVFVLFFSSCYTVSSGEDEEMIEEYVPSQEEINDDEEKRRGMICYLVVTQIKVERLTEILRGTSFSFFIPTMERSLEFISSVNSSLNFGSTLEELENAFNWVDEEYDILQSEMEKEGIDPELLDNALQEMIFCKAPHGAFLFEQ